ncbi:putative bifunctional diguanylate cyclase/phosphodiesterase [Solicola sp. PLA-1-18]|uniref:putative bifunctional diguanylate cyclase/phosphodiesterase n=1 Tax=Solicola sp. PLA-1-18 TaxID=3380532 RepID=UPI003B760822
MPARYADRARPPIRTSALYPFVLCGFVCWGTLLLPPSHGNLAQLLVGGLLMAVMAALSVALPWERWPLWTHAILPFAFFAVIVLLRDVSGAQSAANNMVALPVLWVALYGTRNEMVLAAFCTAAVFIGPLLVIGDPTYPVSDWRRAGVWIAIVAFIGPTVQSVVRTLHQRERERSEAVEDANTAERRWRVLLGQLPDTIVMVADRDMRYQFIGGAGAGSVKFEHNVGRTLQETSSPENVARLEPMYRDALDGRSSTDEMPATHGRSAQQVAVAPFNHHGEDQILVVARDVSRAREREAQIEVLREQVEQLFREAPTGIAVCDLEGRVTRVNVALLEILGRSEADARSTTVMELGLLGDHRGTDALAQVTGSPSGRLLTEVRIDGTGRRPLDLSVSSVYLHDAAGEPSSVLFHVHDVSQRRRFEERLEHLASHDPLTGLANRRRFDDELEGHLRRCQRYGAQGAVMMMDLDHFKEVNDTLGHEAGDQLIVGVTAVLRETLRDSDVISRLGGDEFAILLPNANRDEAELVADRLVAAVRNHSSSFDDALGRTVTASIGVVTINEPDISAGELLSTVDLTMYDAKDAGRDCYAIFDFRDHDTPRSGARIAWGAKIRAALREDRFVLHAQPVMDLQTRTAVGAELLLRMVDEDGDLVPPGRFLYIAERMGLVPHIDRWVVHEGIARLADIQAKRPDFEIAINVSAHSLNDPAFADDVENEIAAGGIDPNGLTFEITETAAIGNMERARAFATRVQALGCRLALDDFGAGYGSFYYLKHLPFDYIKIDGEFVRGCTRDPMDRLIIASVVALAQGAGRQAVAEYVVDEATAVLLGSLGVGLGQGFHLGAPREYDQEVLASFGVPA